MQCQAEVLEHAGDRSVRRTSPPRRSSLPRTRSRTSASQGVPFPSPGCPPTPPRADDNAEYEKVLPDQQAGPDQVTVTARNPDLLPEDHSDRLLRSTPPSLRCRPGENLQSEFSGGAIRWTIMPSSPVAVTGPAGRRGIARVRAGGRGRGPDSETRPRRGSTNRGRLAPLDLAFGAPVAVVALQRAEELTHLEAVELREHGRHLRQMAPYRTDPRRRREPRRCYHPGPEHARSRATW